MGFSCYFLHLSFWKIHLTFASITSLVMSAAWAGAQSIMILDGGF